MRGRPDIHLQHDHHDHHELLGHPRRRGRARLARGGPVDRPDDEMRRGRGGRHEHDDHGGHRDGGAGHRGGRRGGPPGGPFGRGRGRRRDRGDVRTAVLLLLAESPMHGYRIMREVAVRSGGAWRLSPGAVYPTLATLEAESLVTASGDTGRSVYSLTDSGAAAAAELAGVTPPWERADDESIHELFHAVEALTVAARQVAEVGDAAQQTAAVSALVDARRRLYAILAEAPAAPADQASPPEQA